VEINCSFQFFKLLILDKHTARVYNPSKFKVTINEANNFYLSRNNESHHAYDDGYVRLFYKRQMILLFQDKLGQAAKQAAFFISGKK